MGNFVNSNICTVHLSLVLCDCVVCRITVARQTTKWIISQD